MIFFPAIDIKDSKCKRLEKGKLKNIKFYNEDPVAQAIEFQDMGCEWIHVVDIDGAFSGNSSNLDAVRSIMEVDGLKVQLGGGMRDDQSVKQALNLGLERIIVGTRACTEPEWVSHLVKEYGNDRIVVGIDAKDGMVATKGWVETMNVSALDLAMQLQELGVRWIIHTDVATDGAMKGPNLNAQIKMAEAVPLCKVIASGGVTNEKDIAGEVVS